MATLVTTDTISEVIAPINYNVNNPVARLMKVMEEASVMAEQLSFYESDSLQFLFPFNHLELYGPAPPQQSVLNPELQDNKTDFQKQNIKNFLLGDMSLVRGWASVNNWSGPFLKLCYRGDTDSALNKAAAGKLSDHIFLFLSVQGKTAGNLIKVPYNEQTHRYEVEIWGYNSGNLFDLLSEKGKDSMRKELLIVRPDIIQGTQDQFKREGLDDKNMYEIAPENSMHPLHPLKVEVAWTDHTQTFWDSNQGNNYKYSFSMILRGWNNYMQAGVSGSPHGGVGFLHYRNLLSNYKPFTVTSELSRPLLPWMFDANDRKGDVQTVKEEQFLAVDYVDLHILKAECAIGIHRHRDNQEIFFLLNGKALMVMGDWYEFPDRQRAFEIRTLLPGSFSLLKAGQLHALINALDTDATLLMFGGYD